MAPHVASISLSPRNRTILDGSLPPSSSSSAQLSLPPSTLLRPPPRPPDLSSQTVQATGPQSARHPPEGEPSTTRPPQNTKKATDQDATRPETRSSRRDGPSRGGKVCEVDCTIPKQGFVMPPLQGLYGLFPVHSPPVHCPKGFQTQLLPPADPRTGPTCPARGFRGVLAMRQTGANGQELLFQGQELGLAHALRDRIGLSKKKKNR